MREVGISSLKADPFADASIVNMFGEGTMAKSDLVYRINGEKISPTSKGGKVDMKSLYGTKLRFSVEKSNGSTFKDGSSSKDVEMYVPHLVEITKPEILNDSELLPYCFSENLVLEWNADPNNDEGLMVAVEYVGMSANPNMDKAEHILNTDFIEDDSGSWTMNNDLWTGIPDTGIVHLILLRGNVGISEIDGELNKFFAETHAVVSIILIKDMDSLE